MEKKNFKVYIQNKKKRVIKMKKLITIKTKSNKQIELCCKICKNNEWYVDEKFKILQPTHNEDYAYNNDMHYEENEISFVKVECTDCANILLFNSYTVSFENYKNIYEQSQSNYSNSVIIKEKLSEVKK
jgi:hypothetical protein